VTGSVHPALFSLRGGSGNAALPRLLPGAGDQDVMRWFILVVALLLDPAAVLLLLAGGKCEEVRSGETMDSGIAFVIVLVILADNQFPRI